MPTSTGAMTAADFLRLPPWPDGPRLELVEGEVVVDLPLPIHQFLCTELLYQLETWRRERPGRGSTWMPLDVKIDDVNVYNPDIMWYPSDRTPERFEKTSALPHLAIEVRSPSTWRHDTGAKKAAYERRGLCELWLVDTANESVLVLRRSRDGAQSFDVSLEVGRGRTLESPLLPGFGLAIDALFDAYPR